MQTFTTPLCVAVCLFGLSDTELRAGAKKAPDPKDITEIIVQRKSGPAPPTKGSPQAGVLLNLAVMCLTR